jgi:hypothetical protein
MAAPSKTILAAGSVGTKRDGRKATRTKERSDDGRQDKRKVPTCPTPSLCIAYNGINKRHAGTNWALRAIRSGFYPIPTHGEFGSIKMRWQGQLKIRLKPMLSNMEIIVHKVNCERPGKGSGKISVQKLQRISCFRWSGQKQIINVGPISLLKSNSIAVCKFLRQSVNNG